MSWISDTFFGGNEEKAGDALRDAEIEASELRATGIRDSANIMLPAVGEAARAGAEAVTGAADIRIAGAEEEAGISSTAIDEATGIRINAVDEAARIRAEAAQRASDLALAGLGDAKDIFDGIVNQTFQVAENFATDAISAVEAGGSRQRRALEQAYQTASSEYKENIASAKATLGSGFSKAMSAIESQYKSAEEGFTAAINDGRAIVERELAAGKEALSGFEGGQEAFRLQLTMTGALGQEAQAQFYEAYQQSPETLFKLEQAAKLVASGGASGGTKLARLNELGLGIVSQDLDQYFGQLGELAERAQRQGENLADLSAQFAPTFAGLATTEAGGISDIRTGLGDAQKELQVKQALEEAGLDADQATELARMSIGLGESTGASLASEASQVAGINESMVPILADFQTTRLEGETQFATLGADIQSSLERELAAIETGRVGEVSGLETGNVLAQGEIDRNLAQTQTTIGSETELSLGDIERNRILATAGLEAEAETGVANTLAAGIVPAQEAESGGDIRAGDIQAGATIDFLKFLGGF